MKIWGKRVELKQIIEPGFGIKNGIKDFKINIQNLSAFITALVFGITGSFILYVNVAEEAEVAYGMTISWVMSGTVLGAVSTIMLSLNYKQPIVILPSLPALLVVGQMLALFGLNEMVAGYLIAAIIIFLMGLFKIVRKISKFLPIPIIMGMVAGIFMNYGEKMVNGVSHHPLVGGSIILAFLISCAFLKKAPPILITLIVGVVSTLLFAPFKLSGEAFKLYPPIFIKPKFSPGIIFSVSIPLVLLVLADTLKGYGVLRTNDYDPPLNTNTMVAGVVSALSAFFLSHAVSMAGPVTAIVGGADAGDKKHRYVSSVLNAAGMLTAGVLAGFIFPFVKALPSDISSVIAGLAMLGLFTSSLEMAFGSKKFIKGAFTSFIVGLSGFSVLSISAPVWAVIFGLVVSVFTEHKDFMSSDKKGR
jgi:benzoate membrane transport protein